MKLDPDKRPGWPLKEEDLPPSVRIEVAMNRVRCRSCGQVYPPVLCVAKTLDDCPSCGSMRD